MNKTKIEWCTMTWNPVTGCLHGCPYCYARNIAHRFGGYLRLQEIVKGPNVELNKPAIRMMFDKQVTAPYPFDFTPTFHRYRLEEPQLKKQPQNIFVCSMSDLFGEWVPSEWIDKVFDVCNGAPQHRFLFLTKNPKRYEQYIDRYMSKNMWFGWTQTKPCGLEFKTHHAWQTFLSLEPIQAEFPFPNPQFDWLIIGAETGNRKGKVIPKKEWIEAIVNECRRNNIPVFLKNSLAPVWGDSLIQEYPWEKG